jgi:hypothetical protein
VHTLHSPSHRQTSTTYMKCALAHGTVWSAFARSTWHVLELSLGIRSQLSEGSDFKRGARRASLHKAGTAGYAQGAGSVSSHGPSLNESALPRSLLGFQGCFSDAHKDTHVKIYAA